jgi:two-component system LytT family response regulator
MNVPRLRCLLIDDEVLSRLALRQALALHPDCTVVGECANSSEALTAIPAVQPDLVFVDIQMPGMDGFALLRTLPATQIPLVVFVTAFDDHALRAFDAQAVDYLLKPLDQARFDTAMEKVRAHWRGQRATPPAALPLQANAAGAPLQRLSVRKDEHVVVVPVEEIGWIQAEGNYVRIHTPKTSYLHREALSHLEAELDPRSFLRIHRSAVVNIDRIREIHPLFSGDCEVRLEDGTRLTLSRRYRERARAVLGTLP